MAKRKGWDQLSDRYRRDLIRRGATRDIYESGVPLAKYRGHDHPEGLSEKRWEDLKRVAKSAAWPDYADRKRTIPFDMQQLLRDQLEKGMTPAQIKEAIRLKLAAQKAYRRGDRNRAHNIWTQRDPLASAEIYWYHVGQ